MSDEQIIRNCAPTLAGIKTASLFSCNYVCRNELESEISCLNAQISSKGLAALILAFREKSALIYIFRPKQLMADLRKSEAQQILHSIGYRTGTLRKYIDTLRERVENNDSFPHEIGLFLGYPPEDVAGFIQNSAKGYKTVGYWKVYGDASKAEAIFSRYRKCSQLYYKQWLQGRTLEHLVVAC